jgi:peptide/nickel transport system substrate-binding protein
MLAIGAVICAGAVSVAVAGSAGASASASAQNCVAIAGVESSGSKINLDPINQPSSQSSMYVDATHDRLLNKNNNFEVSPQLATRYTSNKTGTVWTFYLRHGVRFQNGKPFTAADVVYTFGRILNPKSDSEALSAFSAFLSPSAIKAINPYEVQFTTKHPVGQFPVLITTKDTWIVENGATNAQIASQGMGTGPFIAVNFQPSASTFEFKRNPNYWQPGLPKAPCLRFTVVQEAASANAAIETGQVDLLQSADLSTVNTLKSNSAIKLLATPPATSITLSMKVNKAPYNNNLVRQALKDVVNRQQMLQVALYGYGAVGDDDPVPPTSVQAWRKAVPAQNIPAAKALLAKAGYTASHPLSVTLYSGDYITGGLSVAELYKQQAAQAGINVNLITVPGATYFTTAWPQQSFRGSAWSLRPAEVSLPLEFEGAGPLSGDNETNWNNPQFNALVAKGAAAPNVALSNGYYKQAEKMLSLQGGAIIPVFFDTVAAVRSTCSGYTPSDDFGQYDFTRLTCS